MPDEILKQAQRDLAEHRWDHFVEGDPDGRAIGDGGQGVIVVGCVKCKLRLNTTPQFMKHLSDDVLPQIIYTVLERTAIAES